MENPKPTYSNLNEKGYIIFENVLGKGPLRILKEKLIQKSINFVFREKGENLSSDDPNTLKLFTDANLRNKKFGEIGKEMIWRNKNSRDPYISKSTGMIHIHFDEYLLDLFTYNEDIYEKNVEVMGVKELVHKNGPERFSIKAPGATDMPQHIDANLFNDKVNYDFRIQSLLTVGIDTSVNPRDSGTICLLTYFHHYWDFARELFHPFRGLFPMKCEMMDSRFFVLPNDKEDKFNRDYLPRLKKYVKIYEVLMNYEGILQILENGEYSKHDTLQLLDQCEQRFFIRVINEGINIPSSELCYIENMDWTPIPMKPGDMIFWHQHLPHQSLRNRSKNTPRICVYGGLGPVEKEWFGSSHQKWVSSQFEKCEFYYSTNENKLNMIPVNVEEIQMMKNDNSFGNIIKKSTSTEFIRRITGQESWWKEENMSVPKDVKCLCDSIIESLKKDKDDDKEEIHQLVFRKGVWSYIPGAITDADNLFASLFPQLEKVCKQLTFKMYGKNVPFPRKSVLYTRDIDVETKRAPGSAGDYYRGTPTYQWNEAPSEVIKIKKIIEDFSGVKPDYVLCHIYRGTPPGKNPGGDYIGWHNDQEALKSDVISVSLGSSRRFQFCRAGERGKVCDELTLHKGDILHMHGSKDETKSCQCLFEHQVPPMNIRDLINHIERNGVQLPKGRKSYKSLQELIEKYNIPPDRINLTFRQYED